MLIFIAMVVRFCVGFVELILVHSQSSLTRLDFGSTTLTGLPARQLNRLQSVLNAAARLVYRYSARRSEHVSPLLCELHWLRVLERIDFRLAVLVHRCFNGTAPCYLASELQRVADTASRRRLNSASSPALHVPRSLHKTIGDRAFPVAAAKVRNKLPPAITSLSSLHKFKRALKTELHITGHSNIDCYVTHAAARQFLLRHVSC